MEVLSKSLAETKAAAQDFLVKLVNPERSRGVVVGLHGDLGSGKTTFTQAVAEILGVKDRVTSPTFVIIKNYEIKAKSPWQNLIHIDAYRLESDQELAKLNWQEIIQDPNNLILIEWPERVAGVMPPDLISINFKFIDEATRQINYE